MYETREAWLQAAVDQFRPWFDQEDAPLPEIQVSVGVQSRANTLATCWRAPVAEGEADPQVAHIFVTPAIDPETPTRLLDILLHELVHAAGHLAGFEGHGKKFGALARALGLTGKMTATVASDELKERLVPIAEVLGPFPHVKLDPFGSGLGPSGKKKQSTRMLKACCESCNYTVRLSRKWIEVAIPVCPNVDCGAYQHDMHVDDV